MTTKSKYILHVSAKCSDLFSLQIECTDTTDPLNGLEHDGYVPDFFPGRHYGDYVQLSIDADTGQILNWKTPTKGQLAALKE